jgi:Mycothiol maleylpyruvate isomerase N-terminal domain/MDMPI C-terminal domain
VGGGEPTRRTRHDTTTSQAEGKAAASLLDWYSKGLAALVDTVRATGADARAMVFLRDAPPPRRFWARRQAHETTIHSVDAIAARCGRWPTASDVAIDPMLAADGIDELLMGFITRGSGPLHAAEPYTVLVRTDDTGHAWTLRISHGPIVTTPGKTERPEAVFSGTAVQLYLSLWDRADEITSKFRSDLVDQWRRQITVRWDSGVDLDLRAERRLPAGHGPRAASGGGPQLPSWRQFRWHRDVLFIRYAPSDWPQNDADQRFCRSLAPVGRQVMCSTWTGKLVGPSSAVRQADGGMGLA